jgi:multidrug efflux system membrane fusion protein
VKFLVSIVFFAVVIGGAIWAYRATHREPPHKTAGSEKVPVSVATADRQDFPVYLDSLGNVQAWNTVTVRSRVDGEIIKIGFDEGQFVKKGDLLVQIDPRPYKAALDQAVAKQTQDQATLENSRRDLQRYETVGTLAASQQQIDTQRSTVSQQEALLRADAGALDNAKVQLGYTTITAPISGRVGFRLVDQGNIVHAGDTGGIATIAEIQPIAVVFTEPQEELPGILDQLKSGHLPVTALTSDSTRMLGKGELDLVDNQVDQTTGSIKLKAKFANEDKILWPGLSVATRLLIRTEKNVVVVPDAAVQRGPDKLFAYVVGDDDKVAMRNLDVGEIQDGKAIIKSGVKPGERVVTNGYYRLQPGSAVEVLNNGKGQSGRATVSKSSSTTRSPEVE